LLLETVPDALTAYQSFELTSEYYTIGRKNSGGPEYRSDVEVETADKKMSRKHAAIRKRGKTGFTLKDIGSKNGVFVNDTKLDADEEIYLGDGDTFRLGETVFRVNIAELSDDLTK
jgi:pSer/pThr/pTyr-binding forkhead associated (FHA) protein